MSAVGPLLSDYRKKSRLSQLDLSLLADVSSRHISFIETGRSQPSRSMLLRLADVLSVPTTYREPKGRYVLEALAAGIASDDDKKLEELCRQIDLAFICARSIL